MKREAGFGGKVLGGAGQRQRVAKNMAPMGLGSALTGLLDGIGAVNTGQPVPKNVRAMTFGPGVEGMEGYQPGMIRAMGPSQGSGMSTGSLFNDWLRSGRGRNNQRRRATGVTSAGGNMSGISPVV